MARPSLCRRPPNKIVALNSDVAEVLVALGAKDKIVGVSKSVKDNPSLGPLFNDTTSVGEWNQPNAESVALLKPDVIITYASSLPKNMDQLTTTNATIVQLDCGNLKTIVGDITAMGIITGKTAEAQDLRAVHPVGHRPGRKPYGQHYRKPEADSLLGVQRTVEPPRATRPAAIRSSTWPVRSM